MRGMPGITEIRSLSRFGLSSVWIYFEEKYDIYFARSLVIERLPAARETDSQGLRLARDGRRYPTALGEISTSSKWSIRIGARWSCARS